MTTAELLSAMVAAVADGEAVGDVCDRFAASTGFSKSKIRTIYYRGRDQAEKHHGNSLLTPTEDRALVYAAQAFSYANYALTRTQLTAVVDDLWDKKAGPTWAREWVKRHRQDLSVRACKALSEKRNSSSVFEEVESWVDQLEGFINERKIPPWAIFNYDECRLVVGGKGLVVKRVQAADRERANVVSTRDATVASLLSVVGGDGAPFLSVYVFRGRFGEGDSALANFVLSRCQSCTRMSWPRFYGWTESGFVDSATFAAVMDLFCREWQVRNPGRDCLLLGDQLQSHRQVEVVRAALKYGVFLWWLVANTSHFLQVLDDKCFAILKRYLPILSEEKIIRALLTSQPTRDCVLQAAYEAERIAFTPTTIKASFKSVGLAPFDRKRVLHLARLNLGMDLPKDGVADQSRAVASQVIRQSHDQHAADSRAVTTGRATVRKSRIYSGVELLDEHSEEVAANEAAAVAKAASAAAKATDKVKVAKQKEEQQKERTMATCRLCMKRTHRGGGGWFVCRCGTFRICPMCSKIGDGKALMGAHSVVCSDLM